MNIALEKRVDLEREVGSEEWALSLLYISEGLTRELEERLKEEERYLGMAKSYINSMWDAFEDVNDEVPDDLWDIFCRETYLLKPVILREYKFLVTRRLSPGDCLIVILKKIYEVISSLTELKDFKYQRQLGTLSKLIGKFFDNIRNRKKNSKLFNLTNSIKECIEAGALGKYTLERIKIETPSLPNGTPKVVTVLDNPGDRLEIGGDDETAITEITWNDET